MDSGLIDEHQLQAALTEQRKWGGKLGRTLVEMGFLDEESMVLVLSHQLHLPAVDLDRAELPADVGRLLRLDLIERHGVFPLGEDPAHRTLMMAASDPTNLESMQEIAARTGMKIQWAVCGSSAIDRAIRRYYFGEPTAPSPTAAFDEPTYELDAVATELPAEEGGAAATALERRVAELTERVSLLEKHTAHQLKALRGLFELLVEKGLVNRTEYLAKIRQG